MLRYLVCLSVLLLVGKTADGCWSAIDPVAYAAQCPILIRGKIVAVAEAPPGGERLDDLAGIRVDEVLENELKDVPLKVGDILTVRMISLNNRSRWSTDLNYPLFTEAVWLVHLGAKGEFRIDQHPVQKQPAVEAGEARRDVMVSQKGKVEGANPEGSVTKARWVARLKKEEIRRAQERAKREAAEKELRAIAQDLARVDNLTIEAFDRFRRADRETRRDVFQLRDHEQPLEGDRLVDVVAHVLKTEADPQVRVFAANALAYTKKPGKRAGDVLAHALSDRDEDVRMFACQALRIREARNQAFPVAFLLGDRSEKVREMAAHTLASLFLEK